MRANRGSVLAATLGFVLVFTMLGVSSIYLGTVQNELAEKRQLSEHAFWLAEGAIDKARAALPNSLLIEPPNLGDPEIGLGGGTYTVSTALSSGFNFQWDVLSSGTVSSYDPDGQSITQTRKIQAVISGTYVPGILNTNGPINKFDEETHECSFPSGGNLNDPAQCDQIYANLDFTFNSVFPNAPAPLPINQTYTDAGNPNDPTHYSNLNPVTGVTLIVINNSNSVQFSASNPVEGSGFFLIDLTGANANGDEPNVRVEIADFEGIIYVKGEGAVDIRGNGHFAGALFVEGISEAGVTGSPTFDYDTQAIEAALSALGGGNSPGKPTIISWKEI